MAKITEPTRPRSSTILIADPNEHFGKSLVPLLKSAGITEIHFACTGQEAVGTAAKLKPDLIMLDRSIQAMDSFAALSNLKYLLPDTKVIMLVSFVDTSSLTRARELGIDGFYSKNTDPAELVRSVCTLLKDTSSKIDVRMPSYTSMRPFIDLNSTTKKLEPKRNQRKT
jgi:DNA-binding NarL/FixJ family response regulator